LHATEHARLKELTGIRLSKRKHREISEATGAALGPAKIPPRNESAGGPAVEDLYISTDGTMAPTINAWREVKIGAIFAARPDSNNQPERLRTHYIGDVMKAEDFGWELYRAAKGMGLGDIHAVCEEASVSTVESPPSINIEPALRVIEKMSPVTDTDLIPLLQRLQDEYGYLPKDVIFEVAERTTLPASRMFGVATFYSQFHLKPQGRHTIRCCRGTACHVRGGKEILDTIRKDLGIEEGETTKDRRFTLEGVACLGTCFLAPVIMIDNDYYGCLTPGKTLSILKGYT